jgi:uncharacterized protein YbjT (DUF2867 family)
MRILVLGGYGLIGMPVVRRLIAAGHAVVGLGRDVAQAQRMCPGSTWIGADIAGLVTPQAWEPILTGARADAIVNCAGALQDGARDDVARVQSAAMSALYRAAATAGVRVFVQISATRARPGAGTRFMETKAEADAALRASPLDWTILKPGLVWAPQAHGGTALIRALAAFPVVTPLVLGDRPVQMADVADVAAAVEAVVAGRVPSRRDYDLVEDHGRPLREVVGQVRAWLGDRPGRELPLPVWAGRGIGRIADGLGWLGWRSPLRTTALQEIAAGVAGDPAPWREATGQRLASLSEILRARPATVQDRWFARFFLVKPVVIATLSVFWLATGLITLARPEAAAAVLASRDLGGGAAAVLATGGAVVDIVLGGLILVRAWMPIAAKGMIAVTLGYLVGATWLAPDLWIDPLGPLIKAIPALMLAVVVLAVAEDR